jgi:hypothetical protein
LQEVQELQQHQFILIQALAIAGQAILELVMPLFDCTPCHTSALSGEGWVLELLMGHPEHIHNKLGVYQQTFSALAHSWF